MPLKKNSILFFLLALAIMSCDSSQVFDQYKTVSNAWHKDDVVNFSINPPDSINSYNLFINVRNTNSYKYNNLFLIVQMNFPHGKSITDTLEYKMAKPSGELLGTGLTSIKENKLWYKEHVVFKESGTYQLNIKHAMRKIGKVQGLNELEGVTDVGFRIEKLNNK